MEVVLRQILYLEKIHLRDGVILQLNFKDYKQFFDRSSYLSNMDFSRTQKLLFLISVVLYCDGKLVDATIDVSSWQPLYADVIARGGRSMDPEQTLDALKEMKSIFDYIKRERSESWNTEIKDLARKTNDLIRLSYIVPRNCRDSYFKMFNSMRSDSVSENLDNYVDYYYNKQLEICNQQGWNPPKEN